MKNLIIGILTFLVLILGIAMVFDDQDLTSLQKTEQITSNVSTDAGLVSIERKQSFASTTSNIRNTIRENENLTLMTEIDHQANAKNVGLQLASSTLFIFGNPNAGTPLMQASESVAIDLPQKLLVTKSSGKVMIYYNNPDYLADRHNIKDNNQRLKKIADLLDSISKAGQT